MVAMVLRGCSQRASGWSELLDVELVVVIGIVCVVVDWFGWRCFRCVPATVWLNCGVMVQMVASGQLMVMVAGRQIEVVLVEVVRIGGAMVESRVVHIHQGVDGETMVGSHLNGTGVMTVEQCIHRSRSTRSRVVFRRCQQATVIQTRFLLEVQFGVE